MSLFSRLSDTDIRAIDSYIANYGANDNYDLIARSVPTSLEYRLRAWDMSKSEFLAQVFGQELIIKKPITYQTPLYELNFDNLYSSTLVEVLEDFSRNHQRHPWMDYPYDEPQEDYVYEYVNDDWLNDPSNYRSSGCCDHLWHFLHDNNYIYDNIYSADNFEIQWKDKPRFKVLSGMKYSRLMIKLGRYFDVPENIIEDWRILHSQDVNIKTLKGNLCLSIHPLDYITMSDGTFTSCMSWMDNGGYRRGTVETMNSEMVVVAYLESENDHLLWYNKNASKEESWNMKKWRSLLVVSPDLVCSIKGYPYQCAELATKAVDFMIDAIESTTHHRYSSSVFTFEEDHCYFIKCDENNDICTNEKGSFLVDKLCFCCSGAMYCDFGCATHYMRLGQSFGNGFCFTEEMPNKRCTKEEVYRGDFTYFTYDYSGPDICMYCGAECEFDDYSDESCVYCRNCYVGEDDEEICYCANCGCRLFSDDAIWTADNCYCSDCAKDAVRYCEACGSYVETDFAFPILLNYKGIFTKSKINYEQVRESIVINNELNGNWCICEDCLSRCADVQRIRDNKEPFRYWHDKTAAEEQMKRRFEGTYDVHFDKIIPIVEAQENWHYYDKQGLLINPDGCVDDWLCHGGAWYFCTNTMEQMAENMLYFQEFVEEPERLYTKKELIEMINDDSSKTENKIPILEENQLIF